MNSDQKAFEGPAQAALKAAEAERPKVEMQLSFVDGHALTIKADPHWLREFVMTNSWCSVGEGEDEVWINGAHVVAVNRVKNRAF